VVVVAPDDVGAVIARTPEMFRVGRVIEAGGAGERVIFAG
jgi:hypothetical protein